MDFEWISGLRYLLLSGKQPFYGTSNKAIFKQAFSIELYSYLQAFKGYFMWP